MNKIALLATLVAMFVLPLAMAATPGGATATVNSASGYPTGTAGNVNVTAGNTYNVTLNTTQSTYRWAGLFGNATGNIVLGDASKNTMFTWNALATAVYAATTQALTWTGWNTANCTDLATDFPWVDEAASDNCTNTFTTQANFTSEATGISLTNTKAAETKDGSGTAYWETLLANDGGNIVFIAPVVAAGHSAFNGQVAQYQMILPVNGTYGNTNPEQYYLWVELK